MFLTSSKFRLTPSDTKILKTDLSTHTPGCRAGTPSPPPGTAQLEGGVRGGEGILEATSKLNFQGQVEAGQVKREERERSPRREQCW